ncbi:hypothetical protein EYB25_009801 [Talaromyces marneffei]|uniref:uncharacterized protein n=1 Tax=Talaromyces marneffei TaxID=37727 RepID=UPI0012A93BAD|nr:uncharacterized protein EYB26_009071 [Talaromyces marneffei]KAE8548008.1 hypothetical protein EYB25_009801 [Talaromyces marneffei]QGA21361.1 hypothetical protein EYB26_009071 [Talaromyces marneffei]
MALSASAIIAIVVVVSALFVTILWTFSGYYRRTSAREEANVHISQEQYAYMRQVRLRNHGYSYSESLFGGRTSQAWSHPSNNEDTTIPNTPMTMGGEAGTPGSEAEGTTNTNEKQSLDQGSANVAQQEKDESRVNYSTYEPAEYFEQPPYESNDYYYGHEEQPQQNEKVDHVPPEQQV